MLSIPCTLLPMQGFWGLFFTSFTIVTIERRCSKTTLALVGSPLFTRWCQFWFKVSRLKKLMSLTMSLASVLLEVNYDTQVPFNMNNILWKIWLLFRLIITSFIPSLQWCLLHRLLVGLDETRRGEEIAESLGHAHVQELMVPCQSLAPGPISVFWIGPKLLS